MSDRKLTRRAVVVGAGVGAGTTAVAAVLGRHGPPAAPRLGTRMTAHFHGGELPVDDPLAEEWRRIEGILVPLEPQQVAPPFLAVAGVREMEARAAHNGEELAFRLAWTDPDADDLDGIARFHDAVAVMLPQRPGEAPLTMGAKGAPVHILQWRASWQRDLERKTGPEDLYPRLVRDIGPQELLGFHAAAPYVAGRAVGNPLSAPVRWSPIEEIVAEGFGSATSLPHQRARGAAVHESGRWTVTIALLLERGLGGAPIEPGSSWPVAFAIWLGSQKNRGSRKHIASWVRLDVEEA